MSRARLEDEQGTCLQLTYDEGYCAGFKAQPSRPPQWGSRAESWAYLDGYREGTRHRRHREATP